MRTVLGCTRLLTLTLIACGSETGSPTGNVDGSPADYGTGFQAAVAPDDACTLFSEDDAMLLVADPGPPLRELDPNAGGAWSQSCTYTSLGEPESNRVTFQLSGALTAAGRSHLLAKAMSDERTTTDIPGLGEMASYAVDMATNSSAVAAFSDDYLVELRSVSDPTADESTLASLVAGIVAQLPLPRR